MKVLLAVRGKMHMPVIVLSGDFLQLGCVKGTLFLGSDLWKEMNMVNILLGDSWRQQGNPEFLRALDNARLGSLSDADIELLKGRVIPAPPINGVLPTFLTPYRKAAADMNDTRMSELPGEVYTFTSSIHLIKAGDRDNAWLFYDDEVAQTPSVDTPDVLKPLSVFFPAINGGTYKPAFIRTAAKMVRDSRTESVITLKIGSQVVFTVNYRIGDDKLVNGTRAVVTGIVEGSHVSVRTYGGLDVDVKPFMFRNELDRTNSVCVLQVPLMKAWALTIHKSQGMTMDNVEIDIGHGVFATGQAYVALSRVRTIDGLYLKRFHPQCVLSDSTVLDWYLSHSRDSGVPAAQNLHSDAGLCIVPS